MNHSSDIVNTEKKNQKEIEMTGLQNKLELGV